jgi:ABC-type multidrug transport system fused ATPase/permease subunit
MWFFDTTPIGRIVNRAGKDMDVIDNIVPVNMHMFLMCLLHVIGTIIVISMGTPIFLAVCVPLFALYVLVQVLQFALHTHNTPCILLHPLHLKKSFFLSFCMFI